MFVDSELAKLTRKLDLIRHTKYKNRDEIAKEIIVPIFRISMKQIRQHLTLWQVLIQIKMIWRTLITVDFAESRSGMHIQW